MKEEEQEADSLPELGKKELDWRLERITGMTW
jgi:hypothetical protein